MVKWPSGPVRCKTLPGALVLVVQFSEVADWRIEVRSASSTGRLCFLHFCAHSVLVENGIEMIVGILTFFCKFKRDPQLRIRS